MGSLMLFGGGGVSRPWQPCSREYRGNMCGVMIDSLPPVPGGAANPALVLSWFLDRYSPADQARIKDAWRQRNLPDVLQSWPDSRAIGKTVEQFAADQCALYQQGFEPNVFLLSKNYDALKTRDEMLAGILPVIAALTQRVGRWCVGWELSLWLSPDDVQWLIDQIAPLITPWGGRLYVHFQTEYASFAPNPGTFAKFWNRNIGLLTGLMYQGDVNWTPKELQDRIKDSLDRFAGGYFTSPDSGFGHPWDDIGLELQAEAAFEGNADEAKQNLYSHAAVTTPPTVGPLGPVSCMGSGNGRA